MWKTLRLLPLLLVSVVVSYGQQATISVSTSNNAAGSTGSTPPPPPKVYVTIPTAPAFTTPATVTDVVGSSLESSEIPGNTADILIGENAIPGAFNNRLRPNAISNRRFKSAGSGRIFIGGDNVAASQQVVASLNNSDNLSYYHLGFKGNSNAAVTGTSGIFHQASVAGTTVFLEDIIVKNVEFAGALINEGTSGEHYGTVTLRFYRVFGHWQEGEVFYIGNTHKLADFSTINNIVIHHGYGTDKGRDGLQITHAADGTNRTCARIDHVTIYDVGKKNEATQRLLTQIHNSNGYVKKSIFQKGPEPANIFTHDFLFEDCYFEWDSNNPIYIGRLKSATAFGSSALAGNGQPIIFRRCIFNPSITVDRLARILETDCNIIFEDCYFSNRIAGGVLGNLISDERGASPANTISNTGYTIGPPLASPEYINHDPLDPDAGKLTSDFYYDLGMGYLTPDPE